MVPRQGTAPRWGSEGGVRGKRGSGPVRLFNRSIQRTALRAAVDRRRVGNTGGTDIGLFESRPIARELQDAIDGRSPTNPRPR